MSFIQNIIVAADLMQTLSLNTQSTSINDASKSGNRGVSAFSTGAIKVTSKPFYPNSYSNATYYYGKVVRLLCNWC